MGLAAGLLVACAGEEPEDTGEVMYCGLVDDPAMEGPWMTATNLGEELVDGADLILECGFQGLYMFEIHPRIGGVSSSNDYLSLNWYLDIEGRNDGPAGHFAARDFEQIFIGCPSNGGPRTIQVILDGPLDAITPLDGLPARFYAELDTLDGPRTIDVDLTIRLFGDDDNWSWCDHE
ncbi:MAG: hypothetical protein KC486_13770 [Myxococcales bacterium]|nr:hypothetical protein [Myxococcales bacterium]